MPYKAFVSSTFHDLKHHRSRVIGALRGMGIFVDPMEDWKADSDEPKIFSQERMKGCDLCVLLVAFRRGYIPDGETNSITQLEYEKAISQGLDVFPFLLDEKAAWYREYDELEKDPDLRAWRTHLVKKHGVEFFNTAPATLDVGGAVGRWLTKKNVGQVPTVQRIDWPEGKSPYPGLEWFDKEYAPLYFGRDREVDDVIAKMSEPQGRFLIISGASGSGKSSLVGAGLWQALLNEGRLPNSQQWRWLRIQPSDGETPWQALTSGLKQVFPKIKGRPPELARTLARGEITMGTLLRDKLGPEQELFLFVDQVEELFTQGFSQGDIQPFLNGLVGMAHDSGSRVWVVATIRSEFIGHLEASEAVRPLMNQGYNYHLGLVTPLVLQEMIERPAQVTDYIFEDNLVRAILDEAGKEPGSLPLVAYALKQLFEQREGQTFTKAAYNKMKGVVGAIGTKADQVMQGLDEGMADAFDRVFAELVHVERDGPPTRKRAHTKTFQEATTAITLIQALASQECRVLVTSGEGAGQVVEVAHEKLFTGWERLREWINKSGEALRLIDYAEEAATRWHERGESPDDLWLSRQRIQDTHQGCSRFAKTPSPVLKRFLNPAEELITVLERPEVSHQDRFQIGLTILLFGDDPRPGIGVKDGTPDIEWIDVPGGKIRLVEEDHVFTVKPFKISKYPVTNAQFQAFIADDGYNNIADWWKGIQHQESQSGRWQEPNAPRENVSWFEAVAFSRWLSARRNEIIRLPTEWEWQQAATSGNPAYDYPWGKEWDAARCNSNESRLNRTTPVGLYPLGATLQGAMDMAGNVWEWCLNMYDNPEKPESGLIDDSAGQRVLRGGAWNTTPVDLRSSLRTRTTPDSRFNSLGFRLAQDTP